MNTKLLKLISRDSRMSAEELAAMLGMSEAEVASEIETMERGGLIRGYKAVIDWDRLDAPYVSAIIELKVTPKPGLGFEDVAQRIARYPEVESVSLMSGACDLIVTVKGRTIHEVSSFLAKEIAIIDSVTSTATQFIMRKYKEYGCELTSEENDDREVFSL